MRFSRFSPARKPGKSTCWDPHPPAGAACSALRTLHRWSPRALSGAEYGELTGWKLHSFLRLEASAGRAAGPSRTIAKVAGSGAFSGLGFQNPTAFCRSVYTPSCLPRLFSVESGFLPFMKIVPAEENTFLTPGRVVRNVGSLFQGDGINHTGPLLPHPQRPIQSRL